MRKGRQFGAAVWLFAAALGVGGCTGRNVDQQVSQHYGYEVTGCEQDNGAPDLADGTAYVCDDGLNAVIGNDGTVYGGGSTSRP